MVNVITIDREYGAGGSDVARKLGARLAWPVWDERLTSEIARLMDCDQSAVGVREERQDPLYYRMLKAFFRGSAEGAQNLPRLKMVDADCIREFAERVVRATAEQGRAVPVGRGSAYYLRDHPDAFHVFIYAPLAERVRRLQHRGESASAATELAETVDRDRAAFIKRYFRRDWPDRHLFHLMVNSSIGDEAAVEIILHGIAAVEELKQ
jgi:cytidylate kinase